MATTMIFCVGEVVGDYQIVGTIGSSENQLFQVEHRITQRREVMRVILAELIFDGKIDRLTQEVEVLARLNHPGIAGVHNAFSLIDRFAMISEFVEGHSLAALISQGLALDRGVDYVCQALTALAYAHANGVLHGNITSANIIITAQGLVKLVNFEFLQSLHDLPGISVLAKNGVLPYAPRKHASGFHVSDPRADVYSVGRVLGEVLTGRQLAHNESLDTVLAQVQQARLSAADQELRRGLRDVILKALGQDLRLRYQSADELLAALIQVKTHRGGLTKGRSFKVARDVLIGALAILFAAAGAIRFNNTYQQPGRPAAVVFAIPAPNLVLAPPASTVVTVRKKRVSAAVSQPISRETTEVEAETPQPAETPVQVETPLPAEPPLQNEPANAIVDIPVPQPENKAKGMWNKLRRINPFHKRKNVVKPPVQEP